MTALPSPSSPSTKVPADPLLGSEIRSYRLMRILGRGGMGTVYEAIHTTIGHRVAIKVLHSEFSREQRHVDRFFAEARVLSIVQHPGLVRIVGFDQLEDGTVYLMMEFMQGEPLGARLDRQRAAGARLPLPEAVQLAVQIADALAAVHQQGIAHRDLKPDNVFLAGDPGGGERARLLDFGIAKFLEDQAGRETTVGLILGTPGYMSPEQCEGRADLDERVDVYALGIILYEMLAGRPPFVAETASALMRMHMFRQPQPLAAQAPDVPSALAALVHQMLAKDRARRPSMAEVSARLRTLRPDRFPFLHGRARRPLLVGLGAVLLALCLGLGWFAWPRRAPVVVAPVVAPQVAPPVVAPPSVERPARVGPGAGKPAAKRRQVRPAQARVEAPPPPAPEPVRPVRGVVVKPD